MDYVDENMNWFIFVSEKQYRHLFCKAQSIIFKFVNQPIKFAFAMKTWEKSKKDKVRQDDRFSDNQGTSKKKKLKPTEKTKYRMREFEEHEE